MKISGNPFSKYSYNDGDGPRDMQELNEREVAACLVAAENLGIGIICGQGAHAFYMIIADDDKNTEENEKRIIKEAENVDDWKVEYYLRKVIWMSL